MLKGAVPGHHQKAAEVPLSKVAKPLMLTWGTVVNWRLIQGFTHMQLDSLQYPPYDSPEWNKAGMKKKRKKGAWHLTLLHQTFQSQLAFYNLLFKLF